MDNNNSSRKQHILEAAAKLFRDRGYAGTSMRDLAEAVELQASSLYNHITGKQEILREICFNNAYRYLDGIGQVEERFSTATDKVNALISLHIEVATQDFTSITAFNDEWRHLKEPHLSHFRDLRRAYEHRFRDIIRQGIESGEFVSVDANAALYTILSAVRWVYDWYRPERQEEVESIRSTISRIILDGLR